MSNINIIRVPSLSDYKSIIYNYNLNGCITSGSDLVWNYY